MLNYVFPTLTIEQMLLIIKSGLSKSTNCKNIIILGAGMAGLVAASLLEQSGHRVTVLEAANRVGGRVLTLRDNFYDGQYLEAGAMRIPHTHLLTLAYIEKFHLPINEFINTTSRDIIYIKGLKVRLEQYEKDPDLFNFQVAPNEKGKTASELLQMAISPVTDLINRDPERGWPWLITELDKYSTDTYLRYNPFGIKLSPGAIEKIKVLLSLEGLSELSFLELYRELLVLYTPDIKFYEVTGGNDLLPRAFLPQLEGIIRYGFKVNKIQQMKDQVIVSCHHEVFKSTQITGDLVISTIPFSVFQFVEIEPAFSFSYGKQMAIRKTKYATSTKTGIQFKSRFWEREGMYGGQSVTDLPIKYLQYPSHDLLTQGKGVVLGSYTWDDDAQPWDSLNNTDRIEYVLKNLASIHGPQVYQEFLAGMSFSWGRNPYSGGAFRMFKPTQINKLLPYMSSPEGKVHFAGEHTSTTPAWIQGAIESGIRVAYEVNNI